MLTLPCNIDGYIACGFLSVHCMACYIIMDMALILAILFRITAI